jgi:hypothetical protein
MLIQQTNDSPMIVGDISGISFFFTGIAQTEPRPGTSQGKTKTIHGELMDEGRARLVVVLYLSCGCFICLDFSPPY